MDSGAETGAGSDQVRGGYQAWKAMAEEPLRSFKDPPWGSAGQGGSSIQSPKGPRATTQPEEQGPTLSSTIKICCGLILLKGVLFLFPFKLKLIGATIVHKVT